jgi:purine-nucleoside phosphorylase
MIWKQREISNYCSLGMKIVDMGSVALFAVGKVKKIKVIFLFVVSDIL